MKALLILLIPVLLFFSSCNETGEYRHLQQNQANAENATEHHGSEIDSPSQVIDTEKQETSALPSNETTTAEETEHASNHGNHFDGLPVEKPSIPLSDTDTEKPEDKETEPSETTDDNPPEEPQPHDAHAAVAVEAEGLSNLYRVSDDLYRSAQPEKGGLLSARDLGIKTVLSLQLISFDTVLESSEQSGLHLEHIPMIPTTVSEEDIIKALKVIHNAEKPVLVHCLHGSDRTGTVVAMYRIIFENWSKEDAKAEMIEEQFGYHSEFANLLDLIDSIDVEDMREKVMNE
ncbi:MAG: dual specificity protein phosphatase family protein [Proteobacteria bacterium]|nr:dual specificity protein phosphatase family protein [Pseudomonadota bacterium]